jgi:Flp pilus assembly protein TadB
VQEFQSLVVVVVVVIPVILRCLAYNGSNASARCSADQSALQAAAKDRSQSRPACPANQRAFTRPDPALILVAIVIVMIAMVMIVVVVAAAPTAAHTAVVGAIVVVLSVRCNKTASEQQWSK